MCINVNIICAKNIIKILIQNFKKDWRKCYEKITKKFLSTVLGLSLFAGFSVSVSSFAREPFTVNEETEQGFLVEKEFDVEKISEEILLEYGDTLKNHQLIKNKEKGWVKVGDVLYYVTKTYDNAYDIEEILPCSLDNKIEVLYIPNSIGNKSVIGVIPMLPPLGKYNDKYAWDYRFDFVDKYFPNLKIVVLPYRVDSLNPYFLRSKKGDIKIMSPRKKNCKFTGGLPFIPSYTIPAKGSLVVRINEDCYAGCELEEKSDEEEKTLWEYLIKDLYY